MNQCGIKETCAPPIVSPVEWFKLHKSADTFRRFYIDTYSVIKHFRSEYCSISEGTMKAAWLLVGCYLRITRCFISVSCRRWAAIGASCGSAERITVCFEPDIDIETFHILP